MISYEQFQQEAEDTSFQAYNSFLNLCRMFSALDCESVGHARESILQTLDMIERENLHGQQTLLEVMSRYKKLDS